MSFRWHRSSFRPLFTPSDVILMTSLFLFSALRVMPSRWHLNDIWWHIFTLVSALFLLCKLEFVPDVIWVCVFFKKVLGVEMKVKKNVLKRLYGSVSRSVSVDPGLKTIPSMLLLLWWFLSRLPQLFPSRCNSPAGLGDEQRTLSSLYIGSGWFP